MSSNINTEEQLKVLEEGLIEMFKTETYTIDLKHLGEGKYQFTKHGEPCVFDEESEFRLRIFLNSFNILTENYVREKEK